MNKLKIREAVVVEGKHDKIRLAAAVDTLVIETRGFGIFKDSELLGLLRMIARERGLIILTDSDTAGFVIRNYLSGAIPPEQVKHAYIPAVFGKERRKYRRTKEGLLGLEGVDIRAVRDPILKRTTRGRKYQRDNPIWSWLPAPPDWQTAGKSALCFWICSACHGCCPQPPCRGFKHYNDKEVFERTVGRAGSDIRR